MSTILHGLPECDLGLKDVRNSSFLDEIEKGRSGANAGLPSSLKLSKKIHGIQKGRYYLLGAHPNIGKTQFVDYFFVLSAWLNAKREGKRIKIFYCSFELSTMVKKAKWCAFYVHWKYQMDWSSDFILGRIPGNVPTDDQMGIIREAYTFVEALLLDMTILDIPKSPEFIADFVVENHYSMLGTIKRLAPTELQKKRKQKGDILSFKAHGEVPLTLLVIDHMALVDGKGLKETMDAMSTKCVFLRNIFELSPVIVQQFNQDLNKTRRESIARHGMKNAPTILQPQQLDFGDSTYTYRDADLVLGLVKPYKFEIEEFEGFPTSVPYLGGLGDCFAALYLIKNRYGNVGAVAPLFMNGIAGIFYDLPDSLEPDLTEWKLLAQKLSQNG
jgi:hypothetical protein